MPTLGLPMPMFVIFVVTVIAGSLGAVHYLVAHVLMGRPFAETPPPVLEAGDADERSGEDRAAAGASAADGSSDGPSADPSEGAGGGEGASGDPAGGSPRG